MGDPVAVELRFEGLQDFSTGDAARLRVELQREHRAVSEAFRRVEQQAEPLPAPSLVSTPTYALKFFESILTDSTNTSISVELPTITSADEGKYVEIARSTATNNVTALAASGQLVQASATFAVAGVGCQRFRVMRGSWWKLV